MVNDNYVNFNPKVISGVNGITTYSSKGEVLKYVDVQNQHLLFAIISFSALTVTKASQVNKINNVLAHVTDLFVSLILTDSSDDDAPEDFEIIQRIKEMDFMQIVKKVKSTNFNLYVSELIKKVENNSIKLDIYEESSEEEEEDENEQEDKIEKKQQVQKKQNSKKVNPSKKKSRKWTSDGGIVENDSYYDNLDFTEKNNDSAKSNDNNNVGDSDFSKLISDANYGKATSDGFVLKDLSSEIDHILSSTNKKNLNKNNAESANTGGAFGVLRKFIGASGSNAVITADDLEKATNAIKENLIKKNVTAEISEKLVASIKPTLLGKKMKNVKTLQEDVKQIITKDLTNILSPNTSVNLLHEISKKQKKSPEEPYVISIVGVNGVGKSTNLSKLAYWLLNNKYNVLIAACDTFRSGAVEQLKVHERNLNKLIASNENLKDVKLQVFEEGYGNISKVSLIARNSIAYAKKNNFDIVLMDTAGRRHNDSKLMAPLKDFAVAAKPDKIIMVGEALVGTDSVEQAANFNKSFQGANRQLDFFIISKCDTVGDLIGTMVNMVYSTGIPILFVGVGQTYTDLRTLSVEWAVETLMS